MGIADNIKRLRTENNLSQVELGKIAGVTDKAVSTWESGVKTPRMGAVEKMAAYFGVPKSAILDDAPISKPIHHIISPLEKVGNLYCPKGQMPLLGRVAAGLPMFADENIEGYIANDFTDGEVYYGLYVHGDSMTAAGIDDGDIVIVRQQPCVDENQIAVVLVNGNDATIKYFRQEGNMVILSPRSLNPSHQVQIYDRKKVPIEVIGRVVQIRKNV